MGSAIIIACVWCGKPISVPGRPHYIPQGGGLGGLGIEENILDPLSPGNRHDRYLTNGTQRESARK